MTIPINMNAATFGTVAFWRSAAPHYGCRAWKEAMRRFAVQHGKAIAMLADDSARIVERDTSKACGVTIHLVPSDRIRWFKA